MNIFNRVVVVILLLVLMIGVTVVLVRPQAVLVDVGDRLMTFGYSLDGFQRPWILLVGGILIALIFDALMLFLLIREIRPKRKRYIQVQEVSGGMATISTESVVQQLEYAIDPISGIIKVKPTVAAKRNKVQVNVEVTIGAKHSVPNMASDLVDVVRQVIVSDLGLQIAGSPKVQIKVATPDQKRPPTPKSEFPEPEKPAESPPPLPVEETAPERTDVESEEKDIFA